MELVQVDKTETNINLNSGDLPIELVVNPVALSAMLDAISLFELNGSKWMLAVPFEFWDSEIHEHCSDEVRHTKMVQDVARKIRWGLSDEEVLQERDLNKSFYELTEKYLSRLSRKIYRLTINIERKNGDFALFSYSILAFLIERRIMKIYPTLARFSGLDYVEEMARTIITDERKHLSFVGERLPDGLDITDMKKQEVIEMEEELAQQWLEGLTQALSGV